MKFKHKRDMFTLKLIMAMVMVFSALSVQTATGESYGNAEVTFIKNYDGDTITVSIPAYPEIIGKKISIRINGIDTPEMRGTKGLLKEKARNAKKLVASLCRKAKKLELRNMQRGKYFRIVADVYADGKSVADALIKNELAKKYDGGTKPVW